MPCGEDHDDPDLQQVVPERQTTCDHGVPCPRLRGQPSWCPLVDPWAIACAQTGWAFRLALVPPGVAWWAGKGGRE